jgi:acetamidase/formamidase
LLNETRTPPAGLTLACMTHHIADPSAIHHVWDRALPPALTIESGDTVTFSIPEIAAEQVHFGANYADCRFDFDTIYSLNGPVYVADARPGDVLQVDILDLQVGSWGWTAVLPGLGLLADEFPDGYVRTYDLTQAVIDFAPGITVPTAPFLGVLGNHPGPSGPLAPFPPHGGGGNMDNRHLTRGTTVFLPVFVEGALFSPGDAHAVQGDGEVCVSAVETFMDATLRFTLLSGQDAAYGPGFSVPAESVSRKDDAGYIATMGIDPDLMTGARTAVRSMVAKLSADHDLSRLDAYVLCSIAGDLKIHEIVDAGVWNVGFTMPNSIFTG